MKRMKKILAYVLTFALVLGLVNGPYYTKAADYTDVTLTSMLVEHSVVDGDNWILYFNTDGYTCTDWSYKYKGFAYEINGDVGTTTQVSSAGDNRLYCTIPTSVLSTADGTVLKIKAGQYDSDSEAATTGLNIVNDFEVAVIGGHLVSPVLDVVTIDPFNHSASSFYFGLKDADGNPISTGYESWNNFLSPSWHNSTRVDTGDWNTVYSGVFIDGVPMDYWGAHFKNVDTGTFYVDGLNATQGTTVTIKGFFTSSTQADWTVVGSYFLEEMTFTYNGSTWEASRPITYNDVTLTGVWVEESKVSGDNWVIYFNTSSHTSTDWSKKYKGFTYEIDGTSGTTTQVSSAEENRLYCTIPTSALSTSDGTVLKIKAGQYDPDIAGETIGLDIINDFEVAVIGNHLVSPILGVETVEPFNHSASSFYFGLKDADGNPISTGYENWNNFLSPSWYNSTRVDTGDWNTVYSGVFIDGVPMDYWGAHFKNVDTGTFYVDGLNATQGTTVTIKGFFTSSTQADWIVVGSYFLKELTFVYDGSEWKYQDGTSFTEYTGTPEFWQSGAGAAGFYFFGNEVAQDGVSTFPYDGDNWTVAATAEDDANSGVFLGDQKTTVFLKKVGANDWYVCMSDAEVVPEAGDIITVKGTFVHENHKITFSEAKFEYDGSQYKAYEEEIVYTEYTGTPAFGQTGAGAAGFYFYGNEVAQDGASIFPYDAADWTVIATAEDDANSGVFLGDQKTTVFLKKVGANDWYVCMSDAEVVPENGDIITVKGTFVHGTHRITFQEASFVYDGSAYKAYVENPTGTPVLSEIEKYGSGAGFYFTSEDGASYDGDWGLTATALDGEDNGVFVNGEKSAINLKKVDTNLWYVCINDAGVTLSYGDVITIKGQFQNGEGSSEIVTFNEASFEFNGRRFGEGTFTATDFTVTGLAYSDIAYDTANNRWNMYFTLSINIPGDIDATYFPYMAYEIDGTEYLTHWFKSSSAKTVDGETIYNLYFPIESDKLAQVIDGEHIITLKAGASQGRVTGTNAARTDGIRLTEDYSFVVGGDYEASAPAIDYTMANGGNANGIYLSSGDSFPTIGWDYNITKVGENDGIFVNGGATDVYIKKYADNQYYVCLSDLGITAEEGTIVMLKGKFTTKGLNHVTFKTAKYIYTGGQWKVYTPTTVTETLTKYGDATRDANTAEATSDSMINSQDLVRIKRYLANDADYISVVNADLNSSGNIDEHDAALERWLLVNGWNYFSYGSRLKGVPTYEDDKEMRLAAYVGPTLEEGFEDYAAAGFTTIIGEERAKYGESNLDAYMQAAADAGLDVLIQSPNIQTMAQGNQAINQAVIAEEFNALCKYDNFRGLFMGDEPIYTELEAHRQVFNVLNTLNAEKDKEFFLSFHPTYVPSEDYIWEDSTGTMSLNEKYAKYMNEFGPMFGEFTYDFYPFRHRVNKILGFITIGEEDYMREGWYNNLELVAKNSKGSYESGITVQAYAENLNTDDHYRDITEADVSFQVYSALAYGMKSIQYFTYGNHWDSSVGTTSCMVYDNGQTKTKTSTYYAVQSVNKEIKAIDHMMLNFNWQGTIGINKTDSDNIMDSVGAYTSLRIKSYEASNDAIIGCLRDVNGYDGFMLVNSTDPSDSITESISVTFNDANRAKVYIDGVESDVALTDGKYENTTLAPGQGIFVIPYIAE